jgi:DNA-binding NtrC family response regulator
VPRILIVDDQEADLDAMRLGAQEVIDSLGGTVDEARDAATAINLLTQHHFDVVVADLQLTPDKKKEGWDVLQYARKRNAGTKVIIVTGYPEPVVEVRSMTLGAFAYMDKFEGESLIERTKKAINGALRSDDTSEHCCAVGR